MILFSTTYLGRYIPFSLFIISNMIIFNSFMYGQGNKNALNYFTLNAGMTRITNQNLLSNYWEDGSGIHAYIETPFYFGDIQLGVTSFPFTGKEGKYPDFRGTLMFFSFGKEMVLPFNFSLFSGIKPGYFLMNFKGDSIDIYQQTESEFAGGVNLALRYMPINNFFISTAADLTVLFTKEHLKFYFISLEAGYRFESPAWLKDIFN